jgi:hypothetical protein
MSNARKIANIYIGLDQANPAASASAILAANPAATNGFYWINQSSGGPGFMTYCVFTDATGASIAGGPWAVGFVSEFPETVGTGTAAAEAALKASAMVKACSKIGINQPGRGMESTRTSTQVQGAWLAVKRAIFGGYSNFFSGKTNGIGGVILMPMVNINGHGVLPSTHRLIYDTTKATILPTNEGGDSCDTGELYCGMWGGTGTDTTSWTTDNNVVPGPEDWGPANTANTTYWGGLTPQVLACVFSVS